MSGCVVRPYGGVVVETPAPPPVAVVVTVPDDYIWDGYEYVGLVGGVYFYLGPGNVWFRCEPWRLQRFHDWERVHPDWHAHAVPNEHYRRDAQGHEHPWHGDHGHGHDHDDQH
jgi:hypothetical protein